MSISAWFLAYKLLPTYYNMSLRIDWFLAYTLEFTQILYKKQLQCRMKV